MSILGLVLILIISFTYTLFKNWENINKLYFNCWDKIFYISKNIKENIIPIDVKIIIKEYFKLIKKKPIYIFVFFLLLPIVSLIFLINLIEFWLYFTYLTIKFVIFYKKKKTIKYNEWKTKLKNFYIIIIKKIFWEKPTSYCFLIFYNITKIIFEEEKKLSLTEILYVIWNIAFKIIILITTKIPFFLTETLIFIILKIDNILSKQTLKNNKNIKETIKYIIVQIILFSNTETEYIIKKLKIKFLKKKIKFNFSSKKDWEKLKNITKFNKALKLLKTKLNMSIIMQKKSENLKTDVLKNYYKNNKNMMRKLEKNNWLKEKELNLKKLKTLKDKNIEMILKEKLNYTKPHLTLIYTDDEGNAIYKNESSNKELWIYNNKNQSFEPRELKFLHKGSVNEKKKTYYTPNIITEKENTFDLGSEQLLKKNQNIDEIKHNLLLSFLLDIKEKGLETKYDKVGDKYILSAEDKNKQSITKTLNKDQIIRESKEIFDEFIKDNQDFFVSITEEYREDYAREILKNFYKTELFSKQELIFITLKK